MLFRLLALLCFVSPCLAQGPEVLRFPAQGFSMESPGSEWMAAPGGQTKEGFRAGFIRKGSGGLVAAKVLAGPIAEGTTPDRLLENALAKVRDSQGIEEHDPLDELLIDGRSAPGAGIDWNSEATGPLRVHLRYVVGQGQGYLLQVHAPAAQWSELRSELEAWFPTFRCIPIEAEEKASLSLAELSARCGSEAAWAPDWEEAAARAREAGRHVLVVVRSYPGFDLLDSSAIETFMDEDLLALVDERLIPLRLDAGMPAPFRATDSYGMSPSTFGIALLLVTASGEVLGDTPHLDPEVCLPWLRGELERHPDPGGEPERRAGLDGIRQALDRGELKLAGSLLDGLESELTASEPAGVELGQLLRMRARLLRMKGQGGTALAELERARALLPLEAEAIDVERAWLLLREARVTEARELLEAGVDGEQALEAGTSAAQAQYQLGLAQLVSEGLDSARGSFERLVQECPESRWAWLAASMLSSEALLQNARGSGVLAWARPEVLEVLAEPEAAPTDHRQAQEASAQGVAWLLNRQREDGSWPSSTELRRRDGVPPHALATAINALACVALVDCGEAGIAAAERGLDFLLESDRTRRTLDLPTMYMDYTAWSAWAQLELVARALAEGMGDRDQLLAYGELLVGDLQRRVRSNGGWSYYLSGSADGSDAVEQSISFTTAAAVMGLVQAREAGVPVPELLVEDALDCLEAMRDEQGEFAYMLYAPSGRASRNETPGAAGRGPACELALFLGGRSSEERLRSSLDLFLAHSSGLAAEVGKALMHAGPETQGCHYPLFDYLMAARAAAQLAPRAKARYRVQTQDLLLATRLADGSFQDTPIKGPCYGTAAVLLSLQAQGL